MFNLRQPDVVSEEGIGVTTWIQEKANVCRKQILQSEAHYNSYDA
jgi:hypothetical protein